MSRATMIDCRINQELPVIALHWKDRDGNTREFASGWTFTVYVTTPASPNTAILAKTSGITLADTNPNVLIEMSASDLATIESALKSAYGSIPNVGIKCPVVVYTRRNADNADDVFPEEIEIRFKPAITPPS